jgi:MoaA/NifB/PqqE/SkfB family radical SAM enzyme
MAESTTPTGIGRLPSQVRVAAGILHGGRAFGGPPQVVLNLTNRCNIRCVHCYFYAPGAEAVNLPETRRARRAGRRLPDADHLAQVQDRDADPGRSAAVIDEALALGTRRFQFGSFGEPFLSPHALDLMARAKRGGAYCISYTNGTLLDREKADALVAMGFDDLRITTMAGTPGAYCRTHPGASEAAFERLSERLRYLSAARGTGRPKMRLACVVLAANSGDLVDFARFARDHGADEVVFRPFDPVGDPGLAELVPTPAQQQEIRAQLEEARSLLSRTATPHNIDAFLRVFSDRLDTSQLYRSIPCYYGWLVMRVDLDGCVYPCCRCFEPLGNVYEGGVAGVWHGEAYDHFRREAHLINRRGTPVGGCECWNCVHHVANARLFRALHPIRARLSGIGRQSLNRTNGE